MKRNRFYSIIKVIYSISIFSKKFVIDSNKRVWIKGKLSVFQTEDKGSIPFTRILLKTFEYS